MPALQLKALPEDTPCRTEALKVVDGHLALLAARDFTKLKRLLHTRRRGVRGGATWSALSIRARARRSRARKRPTSCPTSMVRKVRGQWVAALNEAAMPKLRINRIYADILTRNRDASNQQLAAQLQEAKWLIRNVQQRFDTILRVVAGDRRAAAPLLRARRGRDAPDGAARDRRHARACTNRRSRG